MSITPWEEIGEPQTLAEGYGKRLIRQKLKDHRGEIQDFFFLEGADWAVIFAVTEDGRVVMVRQFEQGSRMVVEEIPGGGAEKGESWEQAVSRELKEETGYEAKTAVSLGKFWLDPRSSHTHCNLFMAQGCRKISSQELDHNEEIEVVLVPLGDYVKKIFIDRNAYRTEAIALIRAFPRLSFLNQCRVLGSFVVAMIVGVETK